MSDQPAYQVLARKYRPETFADLVGQDAMVRTLKNAFAADRIAQAFIMTGIRGTGKTTTARIIAKGMNCIGPDGTGGPTTEPCGQCEHCVAIMEGRHVDVMEMDAASRTGVGDIREIIDSVHYRAAAARYKIYIIDEVHMLSKNAFNALLKTLEEPPAHVKFIFATTEIRQVPVTVLSRCQRFDLRRIEPEIMIALLRKIASSEGAEITDEALALITRAAEGSARDATSLLDQSISHGAGETTADQVRAMLGLADRGRTMDLFERIMRGDAAGALQELAAQYADGADPLAVLRDLAELTHWISVVKITPEAAEDPTIAPDERARGQSFAGGLGQRSLGRAWQMLLKAIEEVSTAPSAIMAAEMAVIRLTHVSDLPSPEELMKQLQSTTPPPMSPGPGGGGGGVHHQSAGHQSAGQTQGYGHPSQTHSGPSGPVASGAHGAGVTASGAVRSGGAAQGTALAVAQAEALAHYPTFDHVLDLIRANRDVRLLVEVEGDLRLAAYQPGRIEFTPTANADPTLASKLGTALQRMTGSRWAVTVVNDCTAPTVVEVRDAAAQALKDTAAKHPLVMAALAAFPKARITAVKTQAEAEAAAQIDALQEVEDEWDPFDED